jgi:hypothetical protein
MRHFLLFILLIIGNPGWVQSQSTNQVRQPDTISIQIPRIHLIYFEMGGPFDRYLKDVMNIPVEDEWMQEASRRLNEFQTVWDKEGVKYLQMVIKEIGLPFPYVDMPAALSVSEQDFTMSIPLIVNVKKFLSSAEKPVPLSVFPIILFHELMHTYFLGFTFQNWSSSPLLKKYDKEPFLTRVHLHLMALEKFVLLKSGEIATLQWLNDDYRANISPNLPPGYNRAWEIVNDIEGHEAFINELKLMPANKQK